MPSFKTVVLAIAACAPFTQATWNVVCGGTTACALANTDGSTAMPTTVSSAVAAWATQPGFKDAGSSSTSSSAGGAMPTMGTDMTGAVMGAMAVAAAIAL